MMNLPEDFKNLLPPKEAKDKRPHMYLWVFDPETNHVHVEDGKSDHPANFPLHGTMAEHVTHPDRVDGYAFAIKNGWRIVDDELGEVDGYIKERVKKALQGEHPAPPLPSIRYHGDPSPSGEAPRA